MRGARTALGLRLESHGLRLEDTRGQPWNHGVVVLAIRNFEVRTAVALH